MRESGDYEQWIMFFLEAVNETARDAIKTLKELENLRGNHKTVIEKFGKARITALKLLNYLEESPIIDIGKTAKDLGLAFNTVSSAVKRLIDAGILIQSENIKRNRVFVYKQYIDILRNGT